MKYMVIAIVEVRGVCQLGVGIPLAGEDAFPPKPVKATPQPPDPSKEINESEIVVFRSLVPGD